MKKNGVITFLLLIAFFQCLLAQHKTSSPWILVWEENFEADILDSSRWSKIPRDNPDWCNLMSDFDSCYAIKEGNLILRGIVNTTQHHDTATYLTGGVWTKDKVSFSQGRLEIKAKLGEATGAWPAIWMLPEGKGWPQGGEIDIMEHLNQDEIVYQTVHSHYTYTLNMQEPVSGSTNKLNRNDYNIYAVEMYTDSLVFMVNDVHTFTYPRIETELEGQFPFDVPFYLLIDMQLGGSWVGKVKPEELPVEMWIDWVRFYKPEDN